MKASLHQASAEKAKALPDAIQGLSGPFYAQMFKGGTKMVYRPRVKKITAAYDVRVLVNLGEIVF